MTVDPINSAVAQVQILFLYFRIFGKVIPKIQSSQDAGCSAARWAPEWVGLLAGKTKVLKSSEKKTSSFKEAQTTLLQILCRLGS